MFASTCKSGGTRWTARLVLVALVVSALPLLSSPALAAKKAVPDLRDFTLPYVPEEGGWRGVLLFGGGGLDLESNFIKGFASVDIGEKTIPNLTDSPDGNSDGVPFATGEVNYTFGESRWQFYFGAGAEDFLQLDVAQQLGVRKQWDTAGVLTIAALNQGIATDVWEDPFVAGAPRRDTERTASGGRIGWDRIFGTGFGVQVQSRKIEIDDERSGQNGGLGLTAAEIASLDREGDQSVIEGSWSRQFGSKFIFEVIARAKDDDRDGEANERETGEVQLVLNRIGPKFGFIVNLSAAEVDYDNENPIYADEADADNVAVGLTFLYKLPVENGRWSLVATAAYAESDSDIDFYDTELSAFFAGVSRRFGKAER